MGFLGGLGTIAGPLLGALVLESLQQYFTQQFSTSGLYLIVYGVLFLVVILLLPRGIVPSRGSCWPRGARAPRAASGADAAVGADVAEVRRMSALIEVDGRLQGVRRRAGAARAAS